MYTQFKTTLLRVLLVTLLFQAFLLAGSLQSFTLKTSKTGNSLVQVCTGTGLQWVDLKNQSEKNKSDTSIKHCPLCGVSTFVNPNTYQVITSSVTLFNKLVSNAVTQNIRNNYLSKPPSQAPPVIS